MLPLIVQGGDVMHAKRRGDRDGSHKGFYPVNLLKLADVRPSRQALLASASLGVLTALGLPNVARAACAPSPQIIATAIFGPILSNGGAITVTGSGSITGGPDDDAIDALTCPITKLTIQSGGAIRAGNGANASGSGGDGGPGGAEVSNRSTIKTLTNSGAISGGDGGLGAGRGGSFVGGPGGAGVSNAGTITTLSNGGAIRGGNGGVGSEKGVGGAGLANSGTLAALTNSGRITGGNGGASSFLIVPGGAGGAGIANSGTIGALTNSGTIHGGKGGIGSPSGVPAPAQAPRSGPYRTAARSSAMSRSTIRRASPSTAAAPRSSALAGGGTAILGKTVSLTPKLSMGFTAFTVRAAANELSCAADLGGKERKCTLSSISALTRRPMRSPIAEGTSSV
jgi:hypothetical protein